MEQVFVLLSRHARLALSVAGVSGFGVTGEASSWQKAACFGHARRIRFFDIVLGNTASTTMASEQCVVPALTEARRSLCVRLVDAGRSAADARLHRVKNRLQHSKEAAQTAKKLRIQTKSIGDPAHGRSDGELEGDGGERGASSVRRLLFGGGSDSPDESEELVASDPALQTEADAGDEDLFGLLDEASEGEEEDAEGSKIGGSSGRDSGADSEESLHHA